MNKRTEIENEYEALLQARNEVERLDSERLVVLELCHQENPNLYKLCSLKSYPEAYRIACDIQQTAANKAASIEAKIIELIGDAVFITRRGECLVPGYDQGDYGISLSVVKIYDDV